jgi:S1-C subfamily serine protease
LYRIGLGGKLFTGEMTMLLSAGALNTQGESLVRTGQLASLRDTALGGVSWAATGAALKGLNSLESNRRMWHSNAEQSALGHEYVRVVRETTIPNGATVIPSFSLKNLTERPRPQPWVVTAADPDLRFYRSHEPAVVRIRAKGQGFGSGFLISEDGTIGTAAHVVARDGTTLHQLKVDLADGRTMPAKVIKLDSHADAAVLKIEGNNYPHFEIGAGKDLAPGTPLYVLGHPSGAKPTFMTKGVSTNEPLAPNAHPLVRARREFTITTDVTIYPGNSGGPIATPDGKVVGILTNSSFEAKGTGTVIERLRSLLASGESSKHPKSS